MIKANPLPSKGAQSAGEDRCKGGLTAQANTCRLYRVEHRGWWRAGLSWPERQSKGLHKGAVLECWQSGGRELTHVCFFPPHTH